MKKIIFSMVLVLVLVPSLSFAAFGPLVPFPKPVPVIVPVPKTVAPVTMTDGCEVGYKFSTTTGQPCVEVVDVQTQITLLTERVAELERQVKLLQAKL